MEHPLPSNALLHLGARACRVWAVTLGLVALGLVALELVALGRRRMYTVWEGGS